jgi:hypothetical protein
LSELDDLYGPVIAAQNGGLKSWEANERLKRYELNQSSAQELAQLLTLAESGDMGFDIMQALTLLWIVNADGDFIFALEETIDLQGTSRRPKMRGVPLSPTVKPLGHPLLVGGAGARIGGEIYIDTSDTKLTWVLNNQSGRYGLHKSRTSEHLDNAAGLVRRYQLRIETDFIPIR